MAFIRKVRTASRAITVQIAYKHKDRIIKIIPIGSAHNDEELNILLTLAHMRLQKNQLELLPEAQPTLRLGIKSHF